MNHAVNVGEVFVHVFKKQDEVVVAHKGGVEEVVGRAGKIVEHGEVATHENARGFAGIVVAAAFHLVGRKLPHEGVS